MILVGGIVGAPGYLQSSATLADKLLEENSKPFEQSSMRVLDGPGWS